MEAILQEALAGAPVTVTLGGKTYPIAFPIQGVILYKSETAKLDRQRKLASGRAALTVPEKRELRDRRRKLLAEADALRPATGEKWNEEKFNLFNELLDDSVACKAALDEDAAAGDSLYDKANWWKISPEGDPERLLLALWVGLHSFVELVYTPRLARPLLASLIDLGNGRDLTLAISAALSAHLIAPSETPEEEPSPNVQSPVTPAPIEIPIPQK